MQPCKVVHELRTTRSEIRKFCSIADNIDLARKNTPYHRESAMNKFQVEFVEQLRQKYLEMKGDPKHEVVVKKFKLPEKFVFDTKNEMRRVVLAGGLYRPDEKNHVDFANKNIGGGFLTYGMAQEEVLCVERADFGFLVAMMYAKGKSITIDDDEALTIEGADFTCGIDFYGRIPENWDAKSCCFYEPRKVNGALCAIDCIRPKWKKYEREHIEWCIKKAYCGFQGVPGDEITTGQWGCGAFFNNKNVMFVVQAMAAWMANKKLIYHARHYHVTKGLEMLSRWGKEKTPFPACTKELVQKCETDPDFETAYDPELVQDEFEEVALSGNIAIEVEEGAVVDEHRVRLLKMCTFMEYAKKKWPDFGEPKGKGKGSKR